MHKSTLLSLGAVFAVALVITGVVFFVGGLAPQVADATYSQNCADASLWLVGTITSTGPGTAYAKITNNSASCIYTVGFASYNVYKAGDLASQTIFDSVTYTIKPGDIINSTRLQIKTPICRYQLDLFQGNPLQPPYYGNKTSGHYLMDSYDSTLPLCIKPTPTPSKTPTPTPTPEKCVLTITKTENSYFQPTDTATYTLNFKNTGNGVCSGSGVKIQDPLDTAFQYIGEKHSANVVPGYEHLPAYDPANHTVTWNAKVLDPGESGWVSVEVKAKDQKCGETIVSNTGRITSVEYKWSWVYSNTVHTKLVKTCPTPTPTPTPVPTPTPMRLNLSHISCADNKTVSVHFVVVHVSDGQQFGSVSFTVNGKSYVAPFEKLVGDTAHYHVNIPLTSNGSYSVTNAVVTVNGHKLALSNPKTLIVVCGIPIPTPTPSRTPTPTPTPSTTPTPTPSHEPTPTPTPTPSITPTPTPSATPTPSNSPTPTPTPSVTLTPIPTPTPSITPTPTPSITPTPTPTFQSLSVQKLVRNISTGTGELDSVNANPVNSLDFVIQVTASGNAAVTNVRVFDSLPSNLAYDQNSTTVDGSFQSDGITSNGLFLGNMFPGQTKIVRFRVTVAGDSSFVAGTTTLTNIVNVVSDNASTVSDSAFVVVNKTNTVINQIVGLDIDKFGRNITKGESGEFTSVSVFPNDTVEFIIHVRSISNTTVRNVIVSDQLPAGLTYIANTTSVNNIIVADGITGSGINIGSLAPNQEAVIKFSALVGSASVFPSGSNSVTNTASVRADNVPTSSAQLPVILGQVLGTSTVKKVSGVSTGPIDSIMLAVFLSLLVTYGYMFYTTTPTFAGREASASLKRIAGDAQRLNFARLIK